MKTPDSCLNKMLDKGYAADEELAAEKLNDIAGVRAVCYFLDDMYQVMEMLRATPGYEFIKVKDYVKKPKASGYQSLHLNIEECEEEFLKCSKSIRKIDKQMLKIRRKIENTQ